MEKEQYGMKQYIFLLLTGIIFGSQFIITHFAIEGFTPLEVGMGRIIFGALTLTLLVPFVTEKKTKSLHVKWQMYAIIGFLEGTLPCVLVPWGQQHVKSAIAAVIISTMPLFAMLFGTLLIKTERFHWLKALSILAGFIGVYILMNPGASSAGLLSDLGPELSILLASMSWALSLVFIKKLPQTSPFVLTRNILWAASIQIIPIWILFGHPSQIHFAITPFLDVLFLGVFTSGVVYIFYVLLIRSSGVNFAAFSNYLVPVVGAILGVVFLNEHFSAHEIVGFLIVIVGLLLQTFYNFGLFQKRKN
jgi:drug/metabolite transporter (DMT)-like permease